MTVLYPLVTIKNNVFLKRGFPWIYSNQIEMTPECKKMAPGTIVQFAYRDKMYALGTMNKHCLIAGRIYCFEGERALNASFFEEALQRALLLRSTLFHAPYYRLVHSEADGLPGFIVDRFNTHFTIQINTAGAVALYEPFIEALTRVFQPHSIYIDFDEKSLGLEQVEAPQNLIIGDIPEQLVVQENDLLYTIPFGQHQKTGWFFDHRNNRKLIASLSKGKKVLDVFSYCGGFALLAASHGADEITCVDRSEAALHSVKTTAELNNMDAKIRTLCGPAFDILDSLSGETFDVIVLDPPAFVKTKKDKPQGLKGYEKLLKKALPLLAPHGFFLLASCSYHITITDLEEIVAKVGYQQGKSIRILQNLGSGPDHPCHPLLPENDYLKGILCAV